MCILFPVRFEVWLLTPLLLLPILLSHRYRNCAESNHNLQPRNGVDGGGHSRGAADIQGNFMSDTDQIHAPHTIKAGKEEKQYVIFVSGFFSSSKFVLNSEKNEKKNNLKSHDQNVQKCQYACNRNKHQYPTTFMKKEHSSHT